MKLRTGRKGVQSTASSDTSGWTAEESDPEFGSGDDGGRQHSCSESGTGESSSSDENLRGEMCSKMRHDGGAGGKGGGSEGEERKMEKAGGSVRGKKGVGLSKGVGVRGKGKAKVEGVRRGRKNDEREAGGSERAVDVDIRNRCALDAIYALNEQLSEVQKEAVRGMVWGPVLEYGTFFMDRHLVQALLQAWNAERKCFKLGRQKVPFSYFDVALLTGLPTVGKSIVFQRSGGGSEVDEVVKGPMEERVERERQRRRTTQKDVRIYGNYVAVLIELCKVNNTPKTVVLFKKLYTLLVVSRLLFPRCARGVVWDLLHVVEDVEGVGEYNWSEAVWEFLVHAMEES